MAKSAVFLDRDGVIIRDVDLLAHQEQVELYNCSASAIHAFHNAGFLVIVVTNQPIVARGLISEQQVKEIHTYIQSLLARSGNYIDAFYFCPHHPSAILPDYRQNCMCRKPNPGMLMQAAQDFGIDLTSSYLVGDRLSDILAGQRAGCCTVLVETGMHLAMPIESPTMEPNIIPDYICADLAAAEKIIVDRI